MTEFDREARLKSYCNGHQMLVDALKGMPKEMWQFKPSLNRWSVHEIIVHIADAEANGYIRLRKLLAEPGSLLGLYDQDKWADGLGYHLQSVGEALELFRLLRKKSADLLINVSADTWKNRCEHPESGTIDLDDYLSIYDDHVAGHIRQMKQNLEEWKAKQPS